MLADGNGFLFILKHYVGNILIFHCIYREYFLIQCHFACLDPEAYKI